MLIFKNRIKKIPSPKLRTNSRLLLFAALVNLSNGATPILTLIYKHNDPQGGNNPNVVDAAVISNAANLTVGLGLTQIFFSGNVAVYYGVNQTTFAAAVANNDYIEFNFTTTATLPTPSSLVETGFGEFSTNFYGTNFTGQAPAGYTFVLSESSTFASTTVLSSGTTGIQPGPDGYDAHLDVVSPYLLTASTTYYIRAYLYGAAGGSAVFDDPSIGVANVAPPAIPEPSSIVTLSLLAGLAVIRRRR